MHMGFLRVFQPKQFVVGGAFPVVLCMAACSSGVTPDTARTTGVPPLAATETAGPVELSDSPSADTPFIAVYRSDGHVLRSLTYLREVLAPAAANAANPDPGPVPFATSPAGNDRDFYLAIRRSELGKKYFMSAYLKNYYPGGVGGGAGRSLGTRVVTFKVQNGKLFVFDVDDRKKVSSTFDPEVVIDAYPIVERFPALSAGDGFDDYVLIDPAAGLNKFGFVGDAAANDESTFQVDLTYLQRFRHATDGITFEQLFSGVGTKGDTAAATEGASNQYRGSGTLGIAFRRYTEGANFVAPAYPKEGEHYFRSEPRRIPNTGTLVTTPVKWNIYPGMTPIKWLIGPQVNEALEKYPAYDVVTAIKKGVENWNAAFGFPVFKAEVATADESFADDDVNMIIWDNDPTFGAAFTDWRTNPNTGEIRGGSIYMNAIWLEVGDSELEDDPPVGGLIPYHPSNSVPPPRMSTLKWGEFQTWSSCTYWASPFRGYDDRTSTPMVATATLRMTKKEKVEGLLTHTLLHEIGHALGLRHNFKGSLGGAPLPSTSLMDYLTNEDSARIVEPASYDVDAVRWLYLKARELPKQAFCTDEATKSDPDCNRFDSTDEPLNKFFVPAYRDVLGNFLKDPDAGKPNIKLNGLLKYVRASSESATRVAAWNAVFEGVGVPLSPDHVTNAAYASRADEMVRSVFQRLFFDDAKLRGDFKDDPPNDANWEPLLLAQLKGVLENSDGARSLPTRRLVVDVLKKLQSTSAYNILHDARPKIATVRATLSGEVANGIDDLLARIDNAVSPYF